MTWRDRAGAGNEGNEQKVRRSESKDMGLDLAAFFAKIQSLKKGIFFRYRWTSKKARHHRRSVTIPVH